MNTYWVTLQAHKNFDGKDIKVIDVFNADDDSKAKDRFTKQIDRYAKENGHGNLILVNMTKGSVKATHC